MVQANSAQREPSMEEILASIRKIIEETDQPVQNHANEKNVVNRSVDRAQTPNYEASASSMPKSQAPHQNLDSPRTLSEVQQRLSRGETTQQHSPSLSHNASVNGYAQPRYVEENKYAASGNHKSQNQIYEAAVAMMKSQNDGTFDKVMPDNLINSRGRQEEKRDFNSISTSIQSKQTENSGMANSNMFQSAQPQPQAHPMDRDNSFSKSSVANAANMTFTNQNESVDNGGNYNDQKSSLISPTPGRQVSQSFDSLKTAFSESKQRSVDELAEDMLRPMLQDWLDNNLPTLVERLVREEIERVARGG